MARGPSTAGRRGSDLLCGPYRLRLALPARGLPALAHQLRLLRPLARRRTLRRLHDQLRALASQAADREAEPSPAVIDSQSIRRGHRAQGQPGLGQRQESQWP
jgi:hypothetical protein